MSQLWQLLGGLLQAVLAEIVAYESGRKNGELSTSLDQARRVIERQNAQLAAVQAALVERHRLEHLDPAAVERLRAWYAAR